MSKLYIYKYIYFFKFKEKSAKVIRAKARKILIVPSESSD